MKIVRFKAAGKTRYGVLEGTHILPVEELVARVSAVMTLLPGDVIATGPPAGVGPMQPGDTVEVRIEGIGSLMNPVIKL